VLSAFAAADMERGRQRARTTYWPRGGTCRRPKGPADVRFLSCGSRPRGANVGRSLGLLNWFHDQGVSSLPSLAWTVATRERYIFSPRGTHAHAHTNHCNKALCWDFSFSSRFSTHVVPRLDETRVCVPATCVMVQARGRALRGAEPTAMSCLFVLSDVVFRTVPNYASCAGSRGLVCVVACTHTERLARALRQAHAQYLSLALALAAAACQFGSIWTMKGLMIRHVCRPYIVVVVGRRVWVRSWRR